MDRPILTKPTIYDTRQYNIQSSTEVQENKGSIIIFPSFVYHQVTPVLRGLRQSLVGWISGT